MTRRDANATTEYGTWADHGAGAESLIEESVGVALGESAADFDVDGLVRAYSDAINAALPDGIVLAGSNFYGPYPRLDVDIAAAIDSVDFWALAERYHRSRT